MQATPLQGNIKWFWWTVSTQNCFLLFMIWLAQQGNRLPHHYKIERCNWIMRTEEKMPAVDMDKTILVMLEKRTCNKTEWNKCSIPTTSGCNHAAWLAQAAWWHKWNIHVLHPVQSDADHWCKTWFYAYFFPPGSFYITQEIVVFVVLWQFHTQ